MLFLVSELIGFWVKLLFLDIILDLRYFYLKFRQSRFNLIKMSRLVAPLTETHLRLPTIVLKWINAISIHFPDIKSGSLKLWRIAVILCVHLIWAHYWGWAV